MTTRLTVPNPAESDERILCNISVPDATAHTPTTDRWDPASQQGMQAISVADLTNGFTISCLNLTDQIITLTLLGCTNPLDAPMAGVPATFSDPFDVTITVPAGAAEAQTYTPGTTGWLQVVWASIQAAGAPANRLNFTAVLQGI